MGKENGPRGHQRSESKGDWDWGVEVSGRKYLTEEDQLKMRTGGVLEFVTV